MIPRSTLSLLALTIVTTFTNKNQPHGSPLISALAMMAAPLGFPPSFGLTDLTRGTLDTAATNTQGDLPPSTQQSYTSCGCGSPGDNTACPFNMCCSPQSTCGNTPDFCTPSNGALCQPTSSNPNCTYYPPPRPCKSGSNTSRNSSTASQGRSVGYYSGSNTRVRKCNTVSPSQIANLDKYTHLYYTFANINPNTYKVEMRPNDTDKMYRDFTALSSSNSNKLETWIAIGGGVFSAPGSATYTTWSDMVSTSDNRAAFINSLVEFMEEYGFQGVDLDWEFPGYEAQGGLSRDTEKLVKLVKDIRADSRWKEKGWGVSMVLPHDKAYLVEYDLKAMEPYVDSFGFMSYDMHGYWETGIGVQGQADIRDIEVNMSPFWSAGIDPAKINLGVPYYGRGYTLKNASCDNLGCPYTGASDPGPCAQSQGILMLSEIQDMLDKGKAKSSMLSKAMMKRLTWGKDQWLAYDDEDTVALKMDWADDMCLGGMMYWSVDQDVTA